MPSAASGTSKKLPTKPKPTSPRATAPKAGASLTLGAEAKKVSSAARERAEGLLAEIGRRKQRIAEEFYDIGLALLEIQKKKLFAALGHATFGALLKERNVFGLSQAHKLIRLVTTVPREQALSLGQEKAIALIDYARATPELDTPRTLVENGVLPGGRRIADASVREVRDAAAAVRKKTGKARRASPEQAAAASEASAMQAWARKRGAKKATAAVVKKEGELWIRVEVPLKSAARVRRE